MTFEEIIKKLELKYNSKPSASAKEQKLLLSNLCLRLKSEQESDRNAVNDVLKIISFKNKEKLKKRKIVTDKTLIDQTNYLLMLGIDYDATIAIKKNIAYEIVDAMAGVYYEDYEKYLIVFKMPIFIATLNELSKINEDNKYTEMFLKKIIADLNKPVYHLETFVNTCIREFFEKNQFPELVKSRENYLSEDRGSFVVEMKTIVEHSISYNKIIYKKLLKKSEELKDINELTNSEFKSIYNFYRYVKDKLNVEEAHAASYALNLLKLRKYMDITKKDINYLHEVAIKLNVKMFDDMEEFLELEKVK